MRAQISCAYVALQKFLHVDWLQTALVTTGLAEVEAELGHVDFPCGCSPLTS